MDDTENLDPEEILHGLYSSTVENVSEYELYKFLEEWTGEQVGTLEGLEDFSDPRGRDPPTPSELIESLNSETGEDYSVEELLEKVYEWSGGEMADVPHSFPNTKGIDSPTFGETMKFPAQVGAMDASGTLEDELYFYDEGKQVFLRRHNDKSEIDYQIEIETLDHEEVQQLVQDIDRYNSIGTLIRVEPLDNDDGDFYLNSNEVHLYLEEIADNEWVEPHHEPRGFDLQTSEATIDFFHHKDAYSGERFYTIDIYSKTDSTAILDSFTNVFSSNLVKGLRSGIKVPRE